MLRSGFWFICLLPLVSCFLPIAASAETGLLGVVKSPENSQQWEGISRRLSLSGVRYCVVDLQQVQNAANLADTKVIFLPNVEAINATQVTALQDWISKGGKVIATGPVGTLAAPNVRSQLRSLLGAYWGFPLTTPTNLNSSFLKNSENWLRENGLIGSVRGGVVIPSGLTSQTVAVWKSKENSPAVVMTDRSVFLGWRWGVDAVASMQLDSAWLKAILGQYGIAANSGGTPEAQKPCPSTPTVASQPASTPAPKPTVASQPASTPAPVTSASSTTTGWSEVPAYIQNNRSHSSNNQQAYRFGSQAIAPIPVILPSQTANSNPQSEEASAPFPPKSAGVNQTQQNKPEVAINRNPSPQPIPILTTPAPRGAEEPGVAPNNPLGQPGTDSVTSVQIMAMRQELESLLGRFESAMLATNTASASGVDLQSDKGTTGQRDKNSPIASSLSVSAKVANQARTALQTFVQLVDRKDYEGARQQWLYTRRTLWDNYPTGRQTAQPEVRAMWVDRGTIVNARSEQDLAKLFDTLAAAGINTVFFETVNAGFTIYPSRVAPQQNPMTRDWDRLAAAVKLAHARGIELHAWVWIFAAGNQRHNPLINMPQEYPGPLVAAYPDWANYDHQGRIFELRSGKVFLDPANPEVRRYLLEILEEIATRYQVDGIQLDYIRYPFQDSTQIYGYGKAALQQFQELTGLQANQISPAQPELWQKWTDFRLAQIDSFVSLASQRLRSKRPELILSAAVFPMPREERLQRLQQNWEDWAIRGDLDLIVPMTYALETNQLQQLAQPLLTRAELGSSLILPGIRLWNLPDVVAVDQIQLLRDLSAGGYSLFAVQDLNNRLSDIFSRTQGPVELKQIDYLPYRQPFRAAANRYAVLQQEWNFVFANKQISMAEDARQEWDKQSDKLGKALNKLASEPSNRNLLLTRSAMESFRLQFSKLMQQSVEKRYQFQVWENRLATLERLLRYGERVVINRKQRSMAQQ